MLLSIGDSNDTNLLISKAEVNEGTSIELKANVEDGALFGRGLVWVNHPFSWE